MHTHCCPPVTFILLSETQGKPVNFKCDGSAALGLVLATQVASLPPMVPSRRTSREELLQESGSCPSRVSEQSSTGMSDNVPKASLVQIWVFRGPWSSKMVTPELSSGFCVFKNLPGNLTAWYLLQKEFASQNRTLGTSLNYRGVEPKAVSFCSDRVGTPKAKADLKPPALVLWG